MKRLISLLIFTLYCCVSVIAQSTTKHIIEKGETLESIAKRYNTTTDKIIELNPFTADFACSGMELDIPKIVTPTKTVTSSSNVVYTNTKAEKKKKRSKFWKNVGTVLLGAAVIGATAYVESQSASANYRSAYTPSYYSNSYNSLISQYGSTSSSNLLNMSSEQYGQMIIQKTERDMEIDKQQFLSQFRSNFNASNGRMPTEAEEREAYTNYLKASVDAHNEIQAEQRGSSSTSSGNSSSSSRSSSSYKSSSNSTSSKKGCPHCDLPGTGNSPGNGKCKTCMGTGLQSSMTLEKIPCANCKSNVGKCQWCGGTG